MWRLAMHFDAFLQRACPPLDLDWRKYRRRAARHRVQQRMTDLGLSQFEDYLATLANDPAEAAGLAELMVVTVSRFFREAPLWASLQNRLLPQLLAAGTGRSCLRVWSVGCAGGEEPYSLALLWRDRLQPRYPRRRLAILASDCDATSLRRARQAIYNASSLREIPPDILGKWFIADSNRWRLSPRITRQVRFRLHNFMRDSSPGNFDLVLARYLPFTYYRKQRRLQAVRRLWRALRPGGALVIGAKESLKGEERRMFAPWPGAAAVYYRLPAGQVNAFNPQVFR
jgi:chemotaxis methyl-accepting protein methylase